MNELVGQLIEMSEGDFTDAQFLGIWNETPNNWNWGTAKSKAIIQAMRQFGMSGIPDAVGFEPSRLFILWYGLSQLTSVDPARKDVMDKTIRNAIADYHEWQKLQKSEGEDMENAIDHFLWELHTHVMSLPSRTATK